MGMKVRRVPPDWEHPRDARGAYLPLFDSDYESARRDWRDQEAAWKAGTHPAQARYADASHCSFREWHGDPPDPRFYRTQPWTEAEVQSYQLYETISEGTPLSPVFASHAELGAWLALAGYAPMVIADLLTVGVVVTGEITRGEDGSRVVILNSGRAERDFASCPLSRLPYRTRTRGGRWGTPHAATSLVLVCTASPVARHEVRHDPGVKAGLCSAICY